MKRLFLVLSFLFAFSVAQADTFIVNQVGTTFDPDSIVIQPGDTVQWIWASLSHTVTSGFDLADPKPCVTGTPILPRSAVVIPWKRSDGHDPCRVKQGDSDEIIWRDSRR